MSEYKNYLEKYHFYSPIMTFFCKFYNIDTWKNDGLSWYWFALSQLQTCGGIGVVHKVENVVNSVTLEKREK